MVTPLDAIDLKKVLMIAFHYPPTLGSSGLQRTLKFSQYLVDYDWQPIVLTVNTRAYLAIDSGQISDIPDQAIVSRAFALDTARHLAINGRYPATLALPDRWVSWVLAAIPNGMRMIRKHKPSVIWSTYPIATAHLIGLLLSRLSGLPWIADFRDSMTEDHYPNDPRTRRMYRWIEHKTIARARQTVFTSPGTLSMYKARYPEYNDSHWALISNGFDEASFSNVESQLARGNRRVHLVHSGTLYPNERDPRPFFSAISDLKRSGFITAANCLISLRATAYDDYYRPMLEELDINDIVSLDPPVSYSDALAEMIESDGLLVLQASNCNHQIPAKIYEYLRAGRPILALTDPEGDTANALRNNGTATIVRIDDRREIANGVRRIIEVIRNGEHNAPSPDELKHLSRYEQTRTLADLFNSVV